MIRYTRELELGKYRRARVWIGDLPDAGYVPIRTLTHTFPAQPVEKSAVSLAAVEVLVPGGGRYLYGLLGGRWEPATTDHLEVAVCVSSPNERSLRDSLATSVDEVHVGLPFEYADAPRAGVEHAMRANTPLGSGKLAIGHAAHGVIGSCLIAYEHLAAILVKLFNSAVSAPSDDQLISLFPTNFSRWD